MHMCMYHMYIFTCTYLRWRTHRCSRHSRRRSAPLGPRAPWPSRGWRCSHQVSYQYISRNVLLISFRQSTPPQKRQLNIYSVKVNNKSTILWGYGSFAFTLCASRAVHPMAFAGLALLASGLQSTYLTQCIHRLVLEGQLPHQNRQLDIFMSSIKE